MPIDPMTENATKRSSRLAASRPIIPNASEINAAGTTIISEKKRVTLQEVLLADAAEDYSPTFPQVTLLSDADAQTIKKLYHTALQKRKHAIIIKLHERIIEITGIKTELKPIDFLKVVLTDYDYYTQQ